MIELFTCPRYAGGLRLTPMSCASQWRRGKDALPWQSIYPCRGCEIGAVNAGEPLPAKAPGRTLCCRCGRTGLRLVRGQICVSCYNREREVRIGKDRRGNVPRSAPPAFSLALMLSNGDSFRAMATNRIELAMFAARKFPGVHMARYFMAPQSAQARLFTGLAARVPARRILGSREAPIWVPVTIRRPSLPVHGDALPVRGSVFSWPAPSLPVPNFSMSFWGGL